MSRLCLANALARRLGPMFAHRLYRCSLIGCADSSTGPDEHIHSSPVSRQTHRRINRKRTAASATRHRGLFKIACDFKRCPAWRVVPTLASSASSRSSSTARRAVQVAQPGGGWRPPWRAPPPAAPAALRAEPCRLCSLAGGGAHLGELRLLLLQQLLLLLQLLVRHPPHQRPRRPPLRLRPHKPAPPR